MCLAKLLGLQRKTFMFTANSASCVLGYTETPHTFPGHTTCRAANSFLRVGWEEVLTVQ